MLTASFTHSTSCLPAYFTFRCQR